MDKEKLSERFLKVYFTNGELLFDINNDIEWQRILNERKNIVKVVSPEWVWNLLTGEITFIS
jgi:hypothetical protein